MRKVTSHIIVIVITVIAIIKVPYAYASGNSFITIVNPQRISSYTPDYLKSFNAEYAEIKSRDLPATWLVTYDVMQKGDFINALKGMDSKQELGLFLEVTPDFAREAHVAYHKTDSWHRATSLFLSGYAQEERKKLIDTLFADFKEIFGYYPVSVGSWWTDAYSLSYMKQKYGITGTLGVSDQYDLDGYQVWGTWWSVPYYPNAINSAQPAQDIQNKLDVVSFRWAARDPLSGYFSASKRPASMYSLQDYATLGLDISYFKNLLNTYALQNPNNQFGQATIGLEGDLHIEDYTNNLSQWLDYAKGLEENSRVQITTMKDFSSWYKKSFPGLSPAHIIQETDLLGSGKQTIWYQSPYYRAGIVFDPNDNSTKIIDYRTYFNNFQEPNYKEHNKLLNLSVNLPFVIDSVIDAGSSASLNFGKLQSVDQNRLVFDQGSIQFLKGGLQLPNKELESSQTYPVPASGITFKSFSFTIPFTLKKKFPFLPTTIFSPIPQTYYVSQTEYEALQVLKKLPRGNVLAYEQSCSKCSFESTHKPAAAAGIKSYVGKYSAQDITTDLSFLLSKTSAEARKILKEKQIKYVYLARYEDYIETLPYLPQDLGLKRVYENANAQIWEITSP
ncbi:MAG: hypothetical protein ACM3IJ_02060 [Candidatus Levyibacteriota bacterium]